MRTLGIFLIVYIFALNCFAKAKVEFGPIISNSNAQQASTAAELRNRQPANDDVSIPEEGEFNVTLKKIKKKNPASRKPTSNRKGNRGVAAENKRGPTQVLKSN